MRTSCPTSADSIPLWKQSSSATSGDEDPNFADGVRRIVLERFGTRPSGGIIATMLQRSQERSVSKAELNRPLVGHDGAQFSNSPYFEDPALWPLRDIELAASRAWRNYLTGYGGARVMNADPDAALEFAKPAYCSRGPVRRLTGAPSGTPDSVVPVRFRSIRKERIFGGRPRSSGSEAKSMAHTFDIRFARSGVWWRCSKRRPTAFAGWQRPVEHRRQGISVAVKRGMLSLLARNRTRRIPAANLKDVFREGDALRVEFATVESPRVSLRFWARDRDTAAQIVQLLPTSRTVEIEEISPASRFRVNRRAISLLGAALVVLMLGGVALRRETLTVPAGGIIAERPSTQNSGPAPAAGETQAATSQGSGTALRPNYQR